MQKQIGENVKKNEKAQVVFWNNFPKFVKLKNKTI